MKILRFAMEEYATDDVPGYACCNDVIARKLRVNDMRRMRSETVDTFVPIGPCAKTELDPANLALKNTLMGKSGRRRIPVNSPSLRSSW